MDYAATFRAFGGPQGLAKALEPLSLSTATSIYTATAQLGGLHHRSGETNRYTKEHHQRVITKEPKIPRPSIFAAHEYSPYEYTKLSSNGSIRLLRLQPYGSGPTKPGLGSKHFLSIKIEEVSLVESPKYEALSYTWGDLPRDFPVIFPQVEGRKISTVTPALFVSPSLYAALIRLRLPTEERVLWIDQLCINQEDVAEKNQQVMLMGKIYEKARGTIVWLGEEDGDKEALSGMVKLLEPHPSNTAKDDINLLKSYLDSKDKKTQGSSQRQALVRLLNRSWFSRAWIFQEAVKSSCISMICGGMKIPFEVLVRLSQATFELEEAERGYAHSLAKSTIGFDTLYLIEHTRPRGCRDSNCERQKLQTGFLGLLMQALQQFEATKQHDLIYAFLAFAGTVTIIPDYGAPVSLTWRDATANIIAATKSLEVFAAVRADARCAFNLPSWVPDWSACYPHARPICAPDFASNFRACDSLPGPQPATHIWEDAPPETLIVQGCTIGTISYISPPNFEGAYYRDTGGLEGVLQLKMHVDPLRRHLGLEPPSHAQHLLPDIEDRLTRTMLADGAFGHNTQPIPDRMRDITSLCKSEEQLEQEIRAAGSADLSPRLASRRDFLERLRQWSLVVQRKKIFLSRRPDGRLDLGLAPSSVKHGDVICLLRGSRVPIVLRPADEGGGDRWRVIGQCYLDGWMYGKVLAGGEREIVGLDRFIVV